MQKQIRKRSNTGKLLFGKLLDFLETDCIIAKLRKGHVFSLDIPGTVACKSPNNKRLKNQALTDAETLQGRLACPDHDGLINIYNIITAKDLYYVITKHR